MLGAGLQFNRSRNDDRFYIPAKGRNNFNQNHKNPHLQRTQSDVVNGGLAGGSQCREKSVVTGSREPDNRVEQTPVPAALPAFEPVALPLSNVERFLESITPSVNAQYLSKTTVRGWRTCDVEYQPYFMLSDLWESFKEWSAYGAGVPLVLNGSDSVVQYYVPSLSAIQIYVKSRRRTSEDGDADCFSRDSSSDGSSDSERDKGLACSRGQRSHYNHPSDVTLKMDRLLLRDQHTAMQEGFSSDEAEPGTAQGRLLFEFYEHDPPFCREPLADKASAVLLFYHLISDLALRFSELKSLRSCDVLSSSWFSVAWYPIYRIPMGPTLKDLEACFLTYHSLYTPMGGASAAQAPNVIYPSEIDGIPRISLPVFGLSSYKFRGPLWISNSGSDRQLVNSLSQAADSWLRQLQVHHPDYLFFCRHR
uniref:DUF789 family protein n=1 Tax=Chenopodium quinoa TaxID=63459 RepID=A0A803KUW5_CHEQI